jgi:hypothetical protein
MTLVSALARTTREEAYDARDVQWQQLQGDRQIVVAVVVSAVQICQ